MAYTALQLITNAYYLSGVVSQDFGTVNGSQTSIGLKTLNKLFADKTIQQELVPFYQVYNFNGVIGQQNYFVQNLIDCDYFCFYIDSNRFETTRMNRIDIQGTFLATTVNALPYEWYLEPSLGGATITVRFKPDQNYVFEIGGKFRLASVTLTQDLTLTIEQYLIDFMEFDLARRLCTLNNQNIPSGVEADWLDYKAALRNQTAPLDLSLQVNSAFLGPGLENIMLASPIFTGWTNGTN